MKKEELINAFMEFIEDKFPEMIEEEKDGFSDGEEFFSISGDGIVFSSIWENHPIDECRLSIGNAFKTREETEFAIEKLKVIHELEMLGRPFELGKHNYFICLEDGKIKGAIAFHCQMCYFDCHFDSEEEVQQAVEKIAEDRIKRYLFGVED